jgi:hypothetical protein
MFARVNTLGWALFEELTSAQMNQLDLNVSRALDGLNGGEYTLTAPLIIHGTVSFDSIGGTFDTAFVSNVSFTSNGSFTAINTGLFTVDDGTTFTINAATTFTSDAEVTFASGSEVTFAAGAATTFDNIPTFTNGYNVTGGVVTYTVAPTFNAGITIGTDDEINYPGSGRGWVVRYPFAAGWPATPTGYYSPHSTEHRVRQIQSGGVGFGARWFCYPQASWGATPITILNAEARVAAFGSLSGTVGSTEFIVLVSDEDYNTISTRTLVDTNPNSSTPHSATLGGFTELAYDPTTQILGLVFMGYDGGDTLDGASKWYELFSWKLTLRAEAMGVY